MTLQADTLEATIDIAASPAQVWAMVCDPRNMKRWSPQLVRSFMRGARSGAGIVVGSKMFNINRQGALVWPTQAMVVRCEAEREIAWRVKENTTIWGLRLEPAEVNGGAGTRLSQYREAPQGISDLSVKLTNAAFGGVPGFTARLQSEMGLTLQRIKADLEGVRAVGAPPANTIAGEAASSST